MSEFIVVGIIGIFVVNGLHTLFCENVRED
jgi:hypothetical protein